jgi:hypothetical protein
MNWITFTKRIIAIVLLIFILGAYFLAPAFQTSTGDGSITPFKDPQAQNKDWKKCSSFWGMLSSEGKEKYDMYTMIGSPTMLRNVDQPEKTLYIAMGVEKEYKQAEVESLKDFYNRGGKIIVADNHDLANSFSQDFEVNYYGQTFWDANYTYNVSFSMVRATVFGSSDATDTYGLVLNRPTGLWSRPNASGISVLAAGSKESYVDRNNNGFIDIYDAQGRIPIIVQYEKKPSTGVIIFMSSSGMFMDDQIDKGGGPNGTQWQFNNNKQFLKDLIENKLLPTGGKIIVDESRHEQNKYLKPVYSSLEAVTILTSNPREMGLLLAGMIMILIMVVFRAKDKEDWLHKYDISSIKRRVDLPDSRREIRDRMKSVVMRKLRMIHSLTNEEMQAMTQTQLASMVKDHDINELLLNDQREFSNEELQAMNDKLRKWEK